MRLFYKTLFLQISVFISANVVGQNVIPNAGFEDVERCPPSITTLKNRMPSLYWYSPSQGTPDLFHTCSNDMNAIPENFMGIAYPAEGNAYAGLCLFKIPQTTYREYLAVKLSSVLEANEEYSLQFYFQPSSSSRILLDTLQLVLSPDSLHAKNNLSIAVSARSRVFSVHSDFSKANGEWQKAVIKFRARGDERFLLIGNFKQPDKINYSRVSRNFPPSVTKDVVAYYYVDFFELEKIASGGLYEVEKPFELATLYFAFDSYKINEEAWGDLEGLAQYLKENDELKLIVKGYADKVGGDTYNERLSLNRAMAIKEFILSFGIQESRISVEGYGSKMAFNKEDSLNRKVEFYLTTN